MQIWINCQGFLLVYNLVQPLILKPTVQVQRFQFWLYKKCFIVCFLGSVCLRMFYFTTLNIIKLKTKSVASYMLHVIARKPGWTGTVINFNVINRFVGKNCKS